MTSQSKKLLILNKDGTLVRPKFGKKFIQYPSDQELIPGVVEALKRWDDDGWVMAIATNQGGIAAGHKTLQNAIDELWFCHSLVRDHFAVSPIEAMAFCPDDGQTGYLLDHIHSGAVQLPAMPDKVWYRKPSPGMLIELSERILNSRDWIKPSPNCSILRGCSILFVGDRPEDRQAANNAGINFLWAKDWRES